MIRANLEASELTGSGRGLDREVIPGCTKLFDMLNNSRLAPGSIKLRADRQLLSVIRELAGSHTAQPKCILEHTGQPGAVWPPSEIPVGSVEIPVGSVEIPYIGVVRE